MTYHNMFLSSQTHLEEDKQFVLLEEEEEDEDGGGDAVLEEIGENEVDEDVVGCVSLLSLPSLLYWVL